VLTVLDRCKTMFRRLQNAKVGSHFIVNTFMFSLHFTLQRRASCDDVSNLQPFLTGLLGFSDRTNYSCYSVASVVCNVCVRLNGACCRKTVWRSK